MPQFDILKHSPLKSVDLTVHVCNAGGGGGRGGAE